MGTPEFHWSARLGVRDQTLQDSRARLAGWVDLVHLVCLVHLVGLVQPNKRDKPNKPNNGLLVLADFFSILLDSQAQSAMLVSRITTLPDFSRDWFHA
ncbi:MAG: hypothetical protein ACREIJ_10165 [Nitrospiraceae bacterium]